LRIHPYDADLNPTELVWADVKCLNTWRWLHPKRQPSSYSPPWEPQILLSKDLSNNSINAKSYVWRPLYKIPCIEVAKLLPTRVENRTIVLAGRCTGRRNRINRIIIRPRSDCDSSDSAGDTSSSESDLRLLVPPSFITWYSCYVSNRSSKLCDYNKMTDLVGVW
jgi:hypothetical protein